MDLSFASLFTRDYWFSLPPSFNFQRLLMYAVVLCALFLLGIVFRVGAHKARVPGAVRRRLKAWGALLVTGSLVGLVFMFFRYEYVPVLSYRFWFGLWAAGMIIGGASIFHASRKTMAQARPAQQADPFLPKPKRKN